MKLPSAEDYCGGDDLHHRICHKRKVECMDCKSLRGFGNAVLEAAAEVAENSPVGNSGKQHIAAAIRKLKEELK